MNKKDIKVKQSKTELVWIIILSALITVAIILRFTPLLNVVIIQMFSDLVISNIWNILVVIVLLTVLYLVKKRSLNDQINSLIITEESEKK